MNRWIDKDTEIYCSFAETAGNTGCQMMNTAFHYYGLNKIYKSFSVKSIRDAVASVLTLNIKGFAVTMPYKIDVVKYVEPDDDVERVGAVNTVLNKEGQLYGYNTDVYSSTIFLRDYDNQKKLYIVGEGGYSKAVKWAAIKNGFTVEKVNRDNWYVLREIRSSIVYNCTPVDITDKIDKSNEFINCLVESETGKQLAKLQASQQFYLYTGLEFPL